MDPIPTTGLTAADVDELTRVTRDNMLKELVSLSEKAQGRPMAMPAAIETPPQAATTAIDTVTSL